MKKLKAQAYAFLFLLAVCMLVLPNLLKATGPKEPPQALTENERFIYESLRAVYAETDTARDTARAALADAATGIDSAATALDTAFAARDSADAAYLLADSAQDTGVVAYALADSAQDSAATAMDTAKAAYDSVLVAGLPYVTAICDTTGDTVQVKALLVSEGVCINFDGPEGDGYLYFYDNSQKKAENIRWDNDPGRFHLSDNVYVSGILTTASTIKVEGKELDIGDAGGFSGVIFNQSTTELEFWIDGVMVRSMHTDGTCNDEVE